MVAWLLRGLVMSAVHIGARVLLGLAIVAWPLESTMWKTVAIAAVVLVALIWGGVDGLIDGREHEDPDDYRDLTMVWLKAGLLAGLISAIVCWILGNWVMAGIGQNSLAIEIFAGGSFTTLLIFVPSLVGAALGRFLTRRQHRKNQAARDAEADDDFSYQQTQPVGLTK
ncbi:B-4DMT family transporter [Williamsia sp. 1135]|uniref:B-4DMT family transporter n=1 Tax=Williamsia sp. 1135 TaxID=1889262 RepID=UPI000A0F6152|nr:B-4DMT family transporter [Williamsia sp. 1135]ORM24053.1 hypothetical protein BFL43_27280 [Williamsia sp. 1135]